MWRCTLLVLIVVHPRLFHGACPPSAKYYVDCNTSRTWSEAMSFCYQYGMSLLNITNSSTLVGDIQLLNSTLAAANCYANFWFSSGNGTAYVGSVITLDDVLLGVVGGLLNAVGSLLGGVLGGLSCLLGGCPASTTPAPVTHAFTVCTRQNQRRIIQKCSSQFNPNNIKRVQFVERAVYAGILNQFVTRSRTSCTGLCSSNGRCVGISFDNGSHMCTLYM